MVMMRLLQKRKPAVGRGCQRIRTETIQGITKYRYNGLHYVSSIKDLEENIKREERDNLGNLIRKYSGRQSGGRTSSVGYSYCYDYLDRLIWVRDPLGREKTFIRDGRGNVIREVDALGQNKCFQYDEAGRMTGVWEYVSPDEYRVTFYKYDDMDHVTEEKRGLHGVGKFETPTRYLTIKKTYDKEGRLVTVSDASMADSLREPVAMEMPPQKRFRRQSQPLDEDSLREPVAGAVMHYTYDMMKQNV